jgi:hypothetical protein
MSDGRVQCFILRDARKGALLRMRSRDTHGELRILMVRSAATPRVSNHER